MKGWLKNYLRCCLYPLRKALKPGDKKQDRAEENLWSTKNRLAAALEIADVGLWESDLKTGILTADKRTLRILGREETEEPLMMESLFGRCHPGDEYDARRIVQEHLNGLTPEFSYQSRLCDERTWIYVRGKVAEWDTNGDPVRFIGTCADISEYKRTEETLLQSEQKYRLLTENLKDVVVGISPEGILTYVSPGIRDLGGYDPDEEVGNHFSKYFAGEEEVRRAQTAFEQLLIGNKSSSSEFMYQPKSRRPFPIEISAKAVLREGRVVAVHLLLRDVRGRKQQEENLRFLSSITQQVREAIIVTDIHRRIIYLNKAAEELYGYSQEELVGQDPIMLSVEAEAQSTLDSVTKAMRTGKDWSGLSTQRRKDGSTIICEIAVSPFIDGEGNASSYIGTVRDVTERKLAEDAVKKGEQRYRTLFEAAGVAIMILKSDIFVDCNERTLEVFGCMRSQFVGQPPFRFSPPLQPDGQASEEKARERISAAITSGPQRFEWVHSRFDGTLFDAEVSLNAIQLGPEPHILVIVRDVTEHKKAEAQRRALQEELEKAQRMESLGILAGGVAHDLNNMLGPLVGYPELILRKLPEDSKIRKQIIRMGNAAQDAADVIQDLLTLARRGRYEMQPLSLNRVVEQYLDSPNFAQLQERKPDIKVKMKLKQPIDDILGSSPHLSKVIMNLVVNAFDAMHENGTLHIETSQRHLEAIFSGQYKMKPGEYVLLKVRDTGMGIAPEDLDKVFEPYYSKKKMGASGSGLGLSVVYGVVKDHGGYYDIFSTVGEGTEFVLYFPVCTETARVHDDDAMDVAGTESVLIVDDVEEQREMASEILNSLGYRTETAAGGREAVDYLRDHSVDIVILDMIMERGFDGLDTYREILKLHPGQKAIVVSGFSATGRVQELQKLGAGRYIKKPYTVDTLSRAVREELDRKTAPIIS